MTTIARTLLDVAAAPTEPALARAIEQAEIRRLFDLAAVERTIARHPHHRGVAPVRRALVLYRDDELTRSDLEAIFRALCDDDHNLPRPLVNHIVEGKEVDFFWPDDRLIVETDGRATHFTIAACEDDRARDAHLLTLGYRTMRVSDLQVRRDAAIVATRLKALLPTSASR